MTDSTRTTQTQPQQETPITDLYNAIKAETGKHSLFLTESIEDTLPLQLAGIDPVTIPPEYNAAANLYSILRGNKTNKTIIVCNVPETAQDWQATIRELMENTYTDIEMLPGMIRKAMKKINRDLQPGNAGSEKTAQYIKTLETYAAQVEERANPKPGNILEYLNAGKYAEELADFQKTTNIKTMFPVLDQRIGGGLYAGLYVIGAASSTGKTTFMLQVADQLAQQKTPVIFFSLEQSRLELVTKSISRIGRKNNPSNQAGLKTSLQIRKGYTSNETETALEYYKKSIAPYVNIIEGNFNTTADTIRAVVERYIKRNNEKPVVIIDYLQGIQVDQTGNKKERRLQVDDTMQALKRLSRDLDTPVIAISSVNRGSYFRPMTMDSFKESGGVEFTADVLLGLEYEVVYSFDKESDTVREKILDEEKQKPCIKMVLKGLKNRYGIGKFKVDYSYIPAFDYFKEEEINRRFSFDGVPMK